MSQLIEENTGGNAKKFAEKSNNNSVTLHNYLKGRIPKADALFNICETYDVNLNWLIAGRGSKDLNLAVSKVKISNFPEIEELQEWITEICREEPDRRAWFRMELKDKLPLFAEWLKKRHEAEAEASYKIVL